MIRKVFVYVLRQGGREILTFESHDEPGFEVPKGGIEPGETPEQAAHRELMEEAGVDLGGDIVEGAFARLGAICWQGEEQIFLLAEAPSSIPDAFDHTVTGTGSDAGMHYRFRWLPVDERLRERLVQGCAAFVKQLLDRG